MPIPTHENLTINRDFSHLGGRLMTDGSRPTPADWQAKPAYPRDLVFETEEAMRSAFSEELSALDVIMQSAPLSRRITVERLMGLAGKRPDLVRFVSFGRVITSDEEGSYVPEGLDVEDVRSTFTAAVNLSRVQVGESTKISMLQMKVSDHVVPGLRAPYSIGAHFPIMDAPWIAGVGGNYLSLTNPGLDHKDQQPLVQSYGLHHFADPEALAETLVEITEIASELFAPAP